MEFENKKTHHGFQKIEFKDVNSDKCSLQISSAAPRANKVKDFGFIWLGIDDVNPQIRVSEAIKMGVETNGLTNGWMKYEIPKNVLLSSRMHLSKTEVKFLIKKLNFWLKTGDIYKENEE